MKKTHFAVLFAAVIIAGLFLWGTFHYRRSLPAAEASAGTISGCTVRWDGAGYQGAYEGEIEDSKPEGFGTFTSADGDFSYQGAWHNGLFDGQGNIYVSGQIRTEGEFRRGKRHGLCRDYSDALSFTEALYDRDIAYGNVCTFADHKLIAAELLVNSVPLATITETAEGLDPETIKKEERESGYIWVEGTVDTVFETDTREYFLLRNEELGLLLGAHENQEGKGSEQTFLPNLQKDDSVRIYGYYGGVTGNTVSEEMKGYGMDFPVIYPVYGEYVREDNAGDAAGDTTEVSTEGTSESAVEDEAGEAAGAAADTAAVPYENLRRQPYLYYGRTAEGTFRVRRCLKQGSAYYIWAEEKTGSRDAVYVLVCPDEGRDEPEFQRGEEISIHGFFNGQYKENTAGEEETASFVIYPEIYVCSLQ